MRIVLKLMLVTFIGVVFTSCTATKHSEIVVAEFDNNKITLGEFEKAYAKNVGGIENAKKDSVENYKNFLDLYVNYKMKLRDAFVRDYQNDEDMSKELNDYKLQVGISYLEEKKIVTPGLKRFYDERSEELRVAHIMFKKGDDSDVKLKLAQSVLDSIKNGKSFEDMVKKYSEDTFSKNNGGDIYWFTAGQVIPSFEEAAYNTKVGEIHPEVVTTKFGYHIIKVTDREKRKYKIRAKHILIRIDPSTGKDGADSALVKITKIRTEIMNGADFDSLAKKYSDDPGSGAKGGDLGFFERRMMVKPFDEAVFSLKVGEISEPVKTRFGYHIIKLVEIKDYPPFEEEIANIKDLYKKSRYNYDYDKYIDSLKKEYNYSVNEEILKKIVEGESVNLDEDYLNSELFTKIKDKTIIKIGNENKTVADLFEYLKKSNSYNHKKITELSLRNGIKDYSKELLLAKKALELEKNDKDFAALMDEYKNGIYIFKLQEEEVWNKVKIDTVALRKMYEEKKDSFRIGEKVKFNELFSADENLVKNSYAKLLAGEEFNSLSVRDSVTKIFKAKVIKHSLEDANKDELSKRAFSLTNVGDYSEPFKIKGGWSIVQLVEKVPARIKTFEEAFPELSSEFQEHESKRLEKAYTDELKNFYKPSYNYEVLENAFKYNKE